MGTKIQARRLIIYASKIKFFTTLKLLLVVELETESWKSSSTGNFLVI